MDGERPGSPNQEDEGWRAIPGLGYVRERAYRISRLLSQKALAVLLQLYLYVIQYNSNKTAFAIFNSFQKRGPFKSASFEKGSASQK